MQDFTKRAKHKIFIYKNLIEDLQKIASKSDNMNLQGALKELKKSLDTARKSIKIREGRNAPIWWLHLNTGEITNNHIEKLDSDYIKTAKMIMGTAEHKKGVWDKSSEPFIFAESC